MIDYSDASVRRNIEGVMKEIAGRHHETFHRRLCSRLNPSEYRVQEYVNGLAFQEGAWYRPMHNVIVPASMIAIVREQPDIPQDLVYVALLHDAGNSLMKVASTADGPDWESLDKRQVHMQIGAGMIHAFLSLLRLQRNIGLSPERIQRLSEIVATHDYPYLGTDLFDPEECAHRGADRTFVPSALSWYKDHNAYHGNGKYLDRARQHEFKLDPRTFLLARLAFFYEHADELPEGWNQERFPLNPKLASWNEGEHCEPPYTSTDKRIVDAMFVRRAQELEEVLAAETPEAFGSIFETAFVQEMDALLSFVDRTTVSI